MDIDGIVCRQAAPEDAGMLAGMRWDFRIEERPDLAATADRDHFLALCAAWMRGEIESGRWVAWVAEVDGGAVAHMWVNVVETIPKPGYLHDRWGYVSNVYTRPAWRNRGVGTVLLARLEGWAREADLELLLLWPSERSVPFYQRAGFAADPEVVTLQLRPYAG